MGIAFGASSFVFRGKPDGRPDVQSNDGQQADAHGPEQFHVALEEMTVAVDGFRPEKELEVPDHVADDKEEKQKAGDGHHKFFPYGR